MTRYEPAWLLFASDAAILVAWGGVFLLVAAAAWVMDRRRHRRDRIIAPDRVGWMPWTWIFLASAVLSVGLVAAALAA